jgi:alginate production protein
MRTSAVLRLVLILIAALAGHAGRARADAGAPRRLAPGSWLSVEGDFDGQGVFQAREVETTFERRASLKGLLDEYDPRTGNVRFGSVRFVLDALTRIEDDAGGVLSRSDLRTGDRVKVALEMDGAGTPRVRRIRRLEGTAPTRRIEGPLESFPERDSQRFKFRLLGMEVQADSTTRWTGIPGPLSTVDDEDLRPGGGIRLGRIGTLSGEVRFDYRGRENFDLTDELQRDVATRRYRAEIEFTFPSTRRLSGMAELKGVDEQALVDEAETFDGVQDVTLGETYLLLSGILTPHGSLQIGRARFDDERDWLFRRDLDALRIFFDFSRAHVEASVSEELVDPVGDRQKDIRNTLLFASLFPGRGNVLSAYLFDRSDRFLEDDGDRRDFSPRYLGIRAHRERERFWSYWLEAARADGSMGDRKLRGRAFDAGVSFTVPAGWEPTLTVGYAFGSGDEDPFDDVDRTFRQTGLHLNNGKWNGVTSFRYYGQLLRPELANLHIETYALGIRPRSKTSFDLVYHRYRLDRPASRLVRSTIRDRRLNLLDLDVGREWDLVIGFEEIPHLEFEIDLGLFRAGEAFLGEVDPAKDISVKVKFVF